MEYWCPEKKFIGDFNTIPLSESQDSQIQRRLYGVGHTHGFYIVLVLIDTITLQLGLYNRNMFQKADVDQKLSHPRVRLKLKTELWGG